MKSGRYFLAGLVMLIFGVAYLFDILGIVALGLAISSLLVVGMWLIIAISMGMILSGPINKEKRHLQAGMGFLLIVRFVFAPLMLAMAFITLIDSLRQALPFLALNSLFGIILFVAIALIIVLVSSRPLIPRVGNRPPIWQMGQ